MASIYSPLDRCSFRNPSFIITSTTTKSKNHHYAVNCSTGKKNSKPNSKLKPSTHFKSCIRDELGLEMMTIAALALAADPIASLVDSILILQVLIDFVICTGSLELAAVGVSISVFNLVSKLFNVPLLNITTSFVAQEQTIGKKLFPAVSTSLALAAGIGIAEAVALSFGSGFFIVIGNLLNAVLDPVLIFLFGLGIGGAAISTVISEYLIAFILLWELNSKVLFVLPNVYGKGIVQYLKSGGLLIGRTIAVLFTMTLATTMAARQGPIQMAGHQICMEVWLAVSLLNDALALSGQALVASGYSQKKYRRAQDVIYKVVQIGLGTGVGLGIILFLGFDTFSGTFTSDTAVLEITRTGVWFVAGSQPMTALAFVLDGLYYGVSDFAFAAYSMVLVGVITSVFLFVAAPVYGLAGVWMGLFLFMTLRVVAGVWRLGSRSGPWEMVWSENNDNK
ncbi:hypothetical protein ACHQM5_017996 [Ranunculus cassubicifolius]